MLKAYAVENLRPGMVIGRDVLDENMNVLVGVGSTLNAEIIGGLLERPIFSVYIEEAEQVVNVPGREFLLDDTYISCYENVYNQLEALFDNIARNNFDAAALQAIVSEANLKELCNGAKAVSQIHNMGKHGGYLVNHCLHVGILAGLMGKWLQWSKLDRYNLIIAGLFIDIGKLRISPEILSKKGKLTNSEFEIIKKHTQLGYEMIARTTLSANRDIMEGVLQHHERCDGSGYPNHLSKDLISRFGKVLAILDIYDAMAADRVFAKRRSPFDVFAILYDDILNGRLDTEYGVLFIKNLCRSLNGNWVGLSNGAKGRIVYMDESRVTSLPVVQMADGQFIDLNTNRNVKVESILTASEVLD